MIWITLVLTMAVFVIAKGRTYEYAAVGKISWLYVRHGIPAGIRILFVLAWGYPCWIVRKPWKEAKKKFWASKKGKAIKAGRLKVAWDIIRKGKPKAPKAPYKLSQDNLWKLIGLGNDNFAVRSGKEVIFWKDGKPVEGFKLDSQKFFTPHDVFTTKRAAKVRPQYRAEAPMPPPLPGTYAERPNA